MENTNRTPEDYAKNYPTVKGTGVFGPVSVGNVGEYNGRVIINLCVKTTRSGDKNATISFPKDWAKAHRFQSGDKVNFEIGPDGYIKDIFHVKAQSVSSKSSVSAAEVNSQAQQADPLAGAKSATEQFESATTDEVAF